MRLIALSFLLLCGCNSLNNSQINSSVSKNDLPIIKSSFLVKFSDNSKFPDNSHLVVTIYDGGLMDTSMQPIGKFEEHIKKSQEIIKGNVEFAKTDLDKLAIPSYSARLEINGKLIGINMSAQHLNSNNLVQTIIIDKVQ